MLISKSKVYELALSSIKTEYINDFRQKYIPNILPIMAEYGGKFLFNGIIQSSIGKKFPVKSFAMLEWPSIDQFIKINKDERVLPLVSSRNQYLDFIKEGCFYKIIEDINFEIPKDKILSILLTNRTQINNQHIEFQWIDDIQNSEISKYLYFSNDAKSHYDKDKDIEKYLIQIQ